MGANEVVDIAERVAALSGPVLLVIIAIAGGLKLWVWGWQYTEMKQERDKLLELVLDMDLQAEEATTMTEVLAQQQPPRHTRRRGRRWIGSTN